MSNTNHTISLCEEEEKTKTQENPTKETERDKNTGTDQDMQHTRRNRQYKTVNSAIQFLDLRVN
jgi:hypothetical protein